LTHPGRPLKEELERALILDMSLGNQPQKNPLCVVATGSVLRGNFQDFGIAIGGDLRQETRVFGQKTCCFC
jgi:hypothetical protein